MQALLGEEYESFLASYDEDRWYGLRVNRLKTDAAAFRGLAELGNQLEPIPWAPDGYYYPEAVRPGKHPHHHAGLYYIQEPSAMAPVELLDVHPGHRVLDLCAAPGGKSTQIAAKLQGQGLLVANDPASDRAKALAKNIERAGVRNAVVLQEEPAALAKAFPGFFDRILVDAPCSGEGMFRKEPSMIAYWGKQSAATYTALQDEILQQAASMLAPGGRLVYSTCTFTPEENECRIATLLQAHPELSIVPTAPSHGWQPGLERFGGCAGESLSGTVRLWPHHVKGEGHYAAVLMRSSESVTPLFAASDDGDMEDASRRTIAGASLRSQSSASRRDYKASRTASVTKGGRAGRGVSESAQPSPAEQWGRFAAEQLALSAPLAGKQIAYGSRLYLQPEGLPSLDGLRVVRPGWYIGEAGKHRFEPSQALAMGLTAADAVRILDLQPDDPAVWRYLRGETVEAAAGRICSGATRRAAEEPKGYVLVCVNGYPLGWGKWQQGVLKNELAPGWRII
ncbi:hypothetical protein PA598K_02822 [Paenibacillus sp. 598K]|nr:hypothetical protein PA598K_02822 [Paenibacillus sp. 598K]